MMRIFLITVALCVTTANALTTSSKLNPFGIVEGIKDCGSAGSLDTVAVRDCTTLPCFLKPNDVYKVDITFTSSITSSKLSLNVYIHPENTLLFILPINGEVQAGVKYEMSFNMPVSEALQNSEFGIRFYILDVDEMVIEVCAEASVSVGPA